MSGHQHPGTLAPEMAQTAETLTVVDNRTGREYTLPIADGAVRATDLAQIDGLLSFDPAFLNTAACRSAITYIDGDAGILRYRGYPIEQLAERGRLPRDRVPAASKASCRRSTSCAAGRTTCGRTRTSTRT